MSEDGKRKGKMKQRAVGQPPVAPILPLNRWSAAAAGAEDEEGSVKVITIWFEDYTIAFSRRDGESEELYVCMCG